MAVDFAGELFALQDLQLSLSIVMEAFPHPSRTSLNSAASTTRLTNECHFEPLKRLYFGRDDVAALHQTMLVACRGDDRRSRRRSLNPSSRTAATSFLSLRFGAWPFVLIE